MQQRESVRASLTPATTASTMMTMSSGGRGSGSSSRPSSSGHHGVLHKSAAASSSSSGRNHPSNSEPTASSKQQQQHQLHRSKQPTITTLASPTSSASSSICSSPPSSSSCSSSCSDCDDEAQAQSTSLLLQVSDGQVQREPRNSTSNRARHSSTCRHRHAARHQHISHSSAASTGQLSHNQLDQQLFSPITSNGSVISSESSSKSRPGSPLKSSVGSILPPAEHAQVHAQPPVSAANVVKRSPMSVSKVSETDGADCMTDGTEEQGGQALQLVSSAAPQDDVDMQADNKPRTAPSHAETSQAEDAVERPQSNPRKSARRHSENGMRTPDEALYAGSSSTQLPYSSRTSSSSTSLPPSTSSSDVQEEAFVAPSMYSRTSSTPVSAHYHHPGTPALTAGTSTTAMPPIPMGMRNPGERRVQNEETRPARRKVHRVDTTQSSTNTSTRDSIGQSRSFSTPALSRKVNNDHNVLIANREVETTFQRPTPHGDSYFPSSRTAQMQSRSTRPTSSNSHSKSTAGRGVSGTSDTLNRGTDDAFMSPDHHLANQQRARTQLQQKQQRHNDNKRYRKLEKLKERESKMEHMDIATFPTNNLLQLLAALLGKITVQNDGIRDGVVDLSSSPVDTVSATKAGTSSSSGNAKKERGDGQDEEMENDAPTDEQQKSTKHTKSVGINTPPSQSRSHSRNSSNGSVTPAVPFSSPAFSRNPSNDGVHDHGEATNGEEKDAFEHDSRLTISPPVTNPPEDDIAKQGFDSRTETDEEKEDSSLQPRYNFYRPTNSSSSCGGPLKIKVVNEQQGGNQQLLRSNTHTILTSAAQALAMPNATLCFHARNIPSISIEAYLIRISKYCPTTNEVFISLLVYFDRMSRLPNLSNLTSSLPTSSTQQVSSSSSNNSSTALSSNTNVSESKTSTDSVISSPSSSSSNNPASHTRTRSSSNPAESTNTIQHSPHSTFAVDSFNIHRLLIAGVTVASKFFSDVFYTNSRYAKVGGLPLAELNALELQFLLLNGFDLIVSPEELQRYADYFLIGALPPLATDSSDRFGSRPSTARGTASNTPVGTPPASRVITPSRTPSASTGRGLFGPPPRQDKMQQEQQVLQGSYVAHSSTPVTSAVVGAYPDPSQTQPTSTLRSAIMDGTRPKTSTRSASESSTSASEASTVVPSESSVDTERGEIDHSTADEEDTGAEDEEEDGDSRMTDVSGAPSPAPTSQPLAFAQFQTVHPPPQEKQKQKEMLPVNATLGADRDGFAIPARPRPPLSRTSSGGNGQRHPLLATSSGSKTPSNGGSSGGHSGGHSSGGKTNAAVASQSVHSHVTKGSAGKASGNKGNSSMHRRDNSRTRQWTLQQQQQMHSLGEAASASADEDAEMADQE